MHEVFGLLDALEATVLEAKHLPLTNKILLDEKDILRLLDKIRITLKGNGDVARKAVDVNAFKGTGISEFFQNTETGEVSASEMAARSIAEAEEYADTIKAGANEYADYILANLQLILTKMQKDMIKLEKNIETGRCRLDEHKVTNPTEVEEEISILNPTLKGER
ncbi:hypothetical protein ACFL96_11820 [Thermoproteota archaeon]